MTFNRDDSMITGEEFRIRRLALNLTQPVIQDFCGVQRSALDRWQQGRANVPRRAREMLEMAEADVQAVADDIAMREPEAIHPDVPDEWPWGETTWFVAIARGRFMLAEKGIDATIGDPHPDRAKD